MAAPEKHLLNSAAILLFLATRAVTAAEVEIDYNRDIRPIFHQHCVACHGGVKQAADLSFVYHQQALTVIEPGNPDDSYLIERVESEDDDERMPPPGHGRRLAEQEVALLRDWIRQGAKWQAHWAFEAPQPSSPPQVFESNWFRKPIDNFILARLELEGLHPSPDAEPDRWLRRVSLDLIGLPPTLEQRASFLAAAATSGEVAYEAEVQRLLDSPRFGERWASMWLDLVRYADSKGLGQDGRRTIWKYRDWVIDALNRDMPFDEFTIKQLAGDLLPDPSINDLTATACHRLTQTNEEGGTDDEQFRIEAVIDRVNTTWQVWQGLTFGCVQCHHHPYDPIRHDEYYRYLAFFNNTVDCDLSDDDPRLPVPFNEEDYGCATELDRKIMQLEKKEWSKECRLVGDPSLWQTLSGLQASTSNSTEVVVEPQDSTEFHTQGTVSKDTTIFLEAPIPSGLDRITAIRLTGLPKNPEKAKADSEWGFVLSHVSAEILVPGSDTPQTVELSRIIGDEPHPLINPQLSLDARNPQGFGAYSRINHTRRVAFIPAQPIAVIAGSRLRLALTHNVFELGAFPLVTHRGRVAVSDDAAFTEWLHDPAVLAVRREKEELNHQRKEIKSVAIPVMRDRLGRFSRPTHVFERGNFLTKGALVQSGTPAFLPPLQASGNADRLDLARWIANAKNPLTSRVIVNRLWAQLFGVGLVRTQEDFGSSGEKPSHPKLLDTGRAICVGDAVEYQAAGPRDCPQLDLPPVQSSKSGTDVTGPRQSSARAWPTCATARRNRSRSGPGDSRPTEYEAVWPTRASAVARRGLDAVPRR